MSREELEACIKANGRDIYSFCCHLAGSRQEADDLYQDTFLKMVEVGWRLDVTGNPKSYLLSVAVNLWRNRRRKSVWRQRITGPVISMEETVLVQRAVSGLPERYRLPVLLFYMEELKLSEIAQVLNIPEGTVKSRLFKAKKLLKKELEVVLNEKRS